MVHFYKYTRGHGKLRFFLIICKACYFLSNGITFAVTALFMVSFMDGGPLHLGPYLEVECMNQKTKLSIESHLIGDQNDIWVVGLRCLVWEEFGDND